MFAGSVGRQPWLPGRQRGYQQKARRWALLRRGLRQPRHAINIHTVEMSLGGAANEARAVHDGVRAPYQLTEARQILQRTFYPLHRNTSEARPAR